MKRPWLDKNGIHLGDSDDAAGHWLIADGLTDDLYAGPWQDATRDRPPAGSGEQQLWKTKRRF